MIKMTGNKAVDVLHGVEFTGNVIPNTWYKTIVNEKGKPEINAIILLAEIVYWYRPSEERVESNLSETILKKKFKGEYVYFHYSQLTEKFGLSEDQCRRALRKLEKLNLIKRQTDPGYANGHPVGNRLYIELFPEELLNITFPDNGIEGGKNHTPSCDKSHHRVVEITPGGSENPNTITKNTTKNINKDYLSIYQAEEERVMTQLDYEYLKLDCPKDDGFIDEIVSIIVDINLSEKEFTIVNGIPKPTSEVRKMFERIDIECVKYVLNSFASTASYIANIRAYIITALYNAPLTMDVHYDTSARKVIKEMR